MKLFSLNDNLFSEGRPLSEPNCHDSMTPSAFGRKNHEDKAEECDLQSTTANESQNSCLRAKRYKADILVDVMMKKSNEMIFVMKESLAEKIL